MPIVTAFFTDDGVPLTSPGDIPTIRIRRIDTQALVVTDSVMTEIGDGLFSYDFTESATLEYTFRCDGDPNASSQVTVQERYVAGSFSGIVEARIKTDIPAILADTINIDSNVDVVLSTRATPAEVNAEVLDVFNVDTFALPGQEAPPGVPTFKEMLSWLYKVLRNKKTQTATEWNLYDDAGAVVDAKATVTDNSVTAIKEEIESGP